MRIVKEDKTEHTVSQTTESDEPQKSASLGQTDEQQTAQEATSGLGTGQVAQLKCPSAKDGRDEWGKQHDEEPIGEGGNGHHQEKAQNAPVPRNQPQTFPPVL